MIIHSGLLPDRMKASMTFSRLVSFLILVSDRVAASSSRSSPSSTSRSISCNRERMASAPMRASNASPYFSMVSR